MTQKIKFIITDVDGCLTEERAKPFDFDLFMKIRQHNELAAQNKPNLPPLTLCTGRPQPYVEALVKMLNSPWAAVCENGGMIYELKSNRYLHLTSPEGNWTRRLQKIKTQIALHILPQVNADFQPGKETHLTLIAPDHSSIEEAAHLLRNKLEPELNDFDLSITESCLNIVPNVFNKGTAFQRQLELLQVSPAQIAAVGDTTADIAFLEQAEYPMCPANAVPAVKSICRFVASQKYTAGLIEIIERCILINQGRVVLE